MLLFRFCRLHLIVCEQQDASIGRYELWYGLWQYSSCKACNRSIMYVSSLAFFGYHWRNCCFYDKSYMVRCAPCHAVALSRGWGRDKYEYCNERSVCTSGAYYGTCVWHCCPKYITLWLRCVEQVSHSLIAYMGNILAGSVCLGLHRATHTFTCLHQ